MEAKLYCFEGAQMDSVQAVIDASGKAVFTVPNHRYRGMATLIVPGAGGVEMIVGEPETLLVCNSPTLNNETAQFPQSEENSWLKHIFTSQSRYMQQQSWLEAGANLFSDSLLLAHIQSEQAKVESSMQALAGEISVSQLYAAQYYRLADFMNRLFATEQKRDVNGALLIRREMEESVDVVSLYTSRQLWGSMLNFYASLFNHTVNEGAKQKQYVESVLKIAGRLSAPYFEAYIAGCITETERFGWMDARHAITEGLLAQHEGFVSSYPVLERAIGAYRVAEGLQLPPVAGLVERSGSYDRILVAFHDSDCNACINEMTRLMQFYPQLEEKGVRVVSVAADRDRERFEAESVKFPWQDKLCDFKGFEGVNFSNYNVSASPSFFLTDAGGKLLGMYFSVADMEKDLKDIVHSNKL
jgi:peroxiredoxin